MTHYGSPCGSVGTGGSVGRIGVAVGAVVGRFVWVGGAVGTPTVAEAVGVAVRVSVAVGNVAAGEGSICGGSDPIVGDADGDAVAMAGASLGAPRPADSCVRLNPARATPTASDGPSSTYKVKEARPVWPRAWPPDFPSPPTPR